MSYSFSNLNISIGPSITLSSWFVDSKSQEGWQEEYDEAKNRLEGPRVFWMNYEIGIS